MITAPAYLIGLGLAKVTCEMDPTTRIVWEGDCCHLVRAGTIIDERDYLLHRWQPSPIASPWNSGQCAHKNFLALQQSQSRRLTPYREALSAALVAAARPDKLSVIRHYRSTAPDAALLWLDTCLAEMPSGDFVWNPLLGTGGNDARLDFSRTYMRAVELVMDLDSGEPTHDGVLWLDHILGLGDTFPPSDIRGGQFFAGDQGVNPWAFILAMEGCLLFAAGAWKYDPSVTTWPNTARLTSVGYLGAAASDEEGGQELWWPIWRTPLSISEVRALLSEQQLYKFGRTVPETGVDYAIASCSSQRQWHGDVMRATRLERNGQAHIITTQQIF